MLDTGEDLIVKVQDPLSPLLVALRTRTARGHSVYVRLVLTPHPTVPQDGRRLAVTGVWDVDLVWTCQRGRWPRSTGELRQIEDWRAAIGTIVLNGRGWLADLRLTRVVDDAGLAIRARHA